MAIYLSAGTATITALMIVDRKNGGSPAAHETGIDLAMRRTVFDQGYDDGPAGSRCRAAVVTAYCDLRTHGAQDPAALHACSALYRMHHPDASSGQARLLVARWIGHEAEEDGAAGCGCLD